MKKLLISALALLALVACNKSPQCPSKQEAMQFGSNIPTKSLRMANNAFEANDAIGISMTGDATATNVEYKTTAGGATATFTPAAAGITFPEGQTVNFVSYYPYSASATTDLAIDLTSTQTDVLYSNNLTGITTAKDAAGANHVLQFKHMLSLVSFNMVGLPAGTTITSAQLEGIVTTSSMKIADGTLTNGTATATQALQLQGGAFAPTIVIPATNSNAKLVVTLSDGKSYSYTFPSLAFQSGKNHKYNVSIAASTITVDEINGQITDWDIVDGGTVTVEPDNTGGGVTPTPPTPTPAGQLLFPGADFEDFAAFTGALNTHGLKPYATKASGAGRNGSTALHINGTPSGNDYVFTVENKAGTDFTGKTKISFYIKGTCPSKSMSCNVYTGGTSYKPFNVGAIDNADKTVSAASQNQYTGSIKATDWVKVTLDISGLTLPTSGSLFAFKIGKDAAWDLYIDDITIE